MNGDLITLACMWIAYCSIHSFLIADEVKIAAHALLMDRYRYYRIFFNILSVVLLIPIVLLERKIDSPPIFIYRGPWRLLQIVLVTTSLALFYFGGRGYDMKEFLGLRQVAGKERDGPARLATDGLLGFVRHPWYLAGMLIIWGRDLSGKVLVTNSVLTGYFIVGSYLEERKLLSEFGIRYEAYKHEVSMLIPIKWIQKRIMK